MNVHQIISFDELLSTVCIEFERWRATLDFLLLPYIIQAKYLLDDVLLAL